MVQGLDPDDQEHGIVEVTLTMIDICIDRGWVAPTIRRDFAFHCLNELFRELSRRPLVEQNDDGAADDAYDAAGACASYDDSSR